MSAAAPAPPPPAAPPTPPPAPIASLAEVPAIAAAFLKLGCLSFGGPVAHLGYLRTEFVERRRWLDDAEYADLVALCQFLPGPGSSQVVFALGMKRGGLPGAIASSFCFMLPSTVLMITFALGIARVGALSSAGWLHGLKLAAVVAVAQAVWSMGRKLCPDVPRIVLAALAAAVLLRFPHAATQVCAIAAGGVAGWFIYRNSLSSSTNPDLRTSAEPVRTHPAALAALLLFAVLLAAAPLLASATDHLLLRTFDSFYRSGSLTFGGGHVVLPLLRAEVVPPGWVTDDAFLAGYGAAQAIPGPLFTFSAYLGAAMHTNHPVALGCWCLFSLMLPAWLLIGGALPFWHRLRALATTQSALRGANAAVVGVLLAAFFNPVLHEGVHSWKDALAALLGLALMERARVPPWAIVLLMAAAGQWILR